MGVQILPGYNLSVQMPGPEMRDSLFPVTLMTLSSLHRQCNQQRDVRGFYMAGWVRLPGSVCNQCSFSHMTSGPQEIQTSD